jgi:hypothetical protein
MGTRGGAFTRPKAEEYLTYQYPSDHPPPMSTSWFPFGLVAFLLTASVSQAGIIQVIETNLDFDDAAIIAPNFSEDALAFSDRTHQHNGAAFDNSGLLTTPTGPTIVPLPSYLDGGEYVRFANDSRENAGYSATVIADEQLQWYLLVDNRINGPAMNTSSSNTTDPVLGGSLAWVALGGWQRVNTGISPNGQADYTAVDEGGDGVGAGQALNQFYSVYRYPIATNVVTVFNNGVRGSNMVSLVAIPEPSTILLTSLSLLALSVARRKRMRS